MSCTWTALLPLVSMVHREGNFPKVRLSQNSWKLNDINPSTLPIICYTNLATHIRLSPICGHYNKVSVSDLRMHYLDAVSQWTTELVVGHLCRVQCQEQFCFLYGARKTTNVQKNLLHTKWKMFWQGILEHFLHYDLFVTGLFTTLLAWEQSKYMHLST